MNKKATKTPPIKLDCQLDNLLLKFRRCYQVDNQHVIEVL